MSDLGIRMQLMIGPTVPLPAPYEVVDSLVSAEVTNRDRDRDGFRLMFSLGKDSLLDYGLLQSGLLDPPSRVSIIVIVGAIPEVLINGVITHHQVVPSNEPGKSLLHITGEDTSLLLDLKQKKVTYRNMSDSAIVTQIVTSYGLKPSITQTNATPTEAERISTQQDTDLKYIQQLAKQNGYVFYIEPTPVPSVNTAYWGPENRGGQAQFALSMNMGPDTNIDSPIVFSFDSLEPISPKIVIIDPTTKLAIPIPVPQDILSSMSTHPTLPLREVLPNDTANLGLLQAALRALSAVNQASDSVTATGELDVVRYGHTLKSRSTVGVSGVGNSYDGDYYVKEVTHRIKRGEYKQSFTLKRGGRGALVPVVVR